MKSVLKFFGLKKTGADLKRHQREKGVPESSPSKGLSSPPTTDAFRVGDSNHSSPAHANCHRVQSYNLSGNNNYPSETERFIIPYQHQDSPDIIGFQTQRTVLGEDPYPHQFNGYASSHGASLNSSTHNKFLPIAPPYCFSGAREEHTPDLLSAGEQQQALTFHSPLWMKRDFPSRSSLRKRATTGRRLPVDMSVRFTGFEESMTDTEVMRRNKVSANFPYSEKLSEQSDVDTDVFTDADSCNSTGRRDHRKKTGKNGRKDPNSSKFFSRHASLKMKSGKRRNEKHQALGAVSEQGEGSSNATGETRRASVPESKRSMTDTEQQQYEESEVENSIFSMAMPSFVFNKLAVGGRSSNQSNDNFKRQGSTGNLMRKPFAAIRNYNPATGAFSETEMSDSARSVKKSMSSDNFQGSGLLSVNGPSTVKHKVGQGLAHSSLVAPTSKPSRKQSKASMEDTMVTLFEAVEVCNLDKIWELLSIGVRDINAPNEDEFTVLDLATLLNFENMAAELLKHGARENTKFMVKEMRIQHVNHLLKRCDAQIGVLVPALVTATQGSTTNAQRAAKETELRFWEWRQRLLSKMKTCFELARAPEPPSKIELSVISSTAVKVTFAPPKSTNGSLVTRYRISWSKSSSFATIEGEHVMLDLRDLELVIRGLTTGVEVFVKVSAANIKGFGLSQVSNPPSATPSHWREISKKEPRCSGKKVTELSLMFEQVKYSCLGLSLDNSPSKRTLKHLLPTHAKFSKNLNKGVYLSCALYTPDDRVVVTSDDVIPTVEVDDGTPANISQDFHWFLKLSVVWEDIPTLCSDLSLTSSNTSISFRAKLVQAVFALQCLLSLRDIGRVYHRVLRDNHGNMIFVLIGHLPDNKCPSGSGVKLSPLSKVVGKRKPKLDMSLSQSVTDTSSLNGGSINASSVGANFSSSLLDDFSALDMLFLDLEELIRFHQNQESALKPGLYLTLLKAESSINTLNVQVPYNCPNMTTCVKIRDNAHVSKEEWSWIYNSDTPIQNSSNSSDASSSFHKSGSQPSSSNHHPAVSQGSNHGYGLTMSQANFRRCLAIAAGKLFKKLAIKDDNGYRIHKDEIIEVNSDVSVILMLPPEVTSVNKYSDSMSTANNNNGQLVPLTVQLFEFTHLMVYQHYITSAYCRLCCLTDTLQLVANYQTREAFTDEEMRSAKKRLETLSEVADKTEIIWHSMRWLLDILQQNRMARNKLGIPLKTLLDTTANNVVEQSGMKSLQSQTSLPGQKQTFHGMNGSSSQGQLSNALRSVSQNHISNSNVSKSGQSSKCIVLQVYPRFNCGLPRGTSVRVVINSRATCKDVVQLVITELSKVASSHNPHLTWDANPDLFQLCVVLGDNNEQSMPENSPPVPSSPDIQSNSVKYIVKLKTNANYFSKFSDI